MATYVRRPNGWQAQIRRVGRPSLTRTFRVRADAESWAAQKESEIARGSYRERSLDHQFTLGLLIDRYLEQVTPFKKGAAVEATRLRAIRRDPVCDIRLSDYRPLDMASYRDRRLAKVSGSTVNRELNLISHVFTIGRKEWGVSMENPVAHLRRPKHNRARSRRLNPGEEAALVYELRPRQRDTHGHYLPGGCRSPLMLPLVQLALATSMRLGELLGLRWENIHVDQKFVHLPDSKNGESRDVPLSRLARDILTGLPCSTLGRVFPLSTEAAKRAFVRATERAHLTDLHFHDLRHEAISRMAPLIRDSLTLSKVTGHKSTRMLGRYFHPRADYLADLLDGLPATPHAPEILSPSTVSLSRCPSANTMAASSAGQRPESSAGKLELAELLNLVVMQLKGTPPHDECP